MKASMRVVGAVAAVTLLVRSAVAQYGLETLTGWSALEALDDALEDRGLFSRADWGDFDGDGRADALGVEGDRAFVLFNPGATFAFVALDGVTRGACALRGAQDRIALASDVGVSVLRFDAGVCTSQAVLQGAWAAACDLRSFDLDGDGASELAGLAADRSGVLLARELGGVWTSTLTLSPGAAVRDVVALQWDADGPLELAVLSDIGASLFDHDGALLGAWTAALGGGAIARVSQHGEPLDRLAWVSAFAPGTSQWLRTLAPDGSLEQTQLGELGAYAMVGEDFDGDGDSDLLIAPRHGEALLWLRNLRSASNPLCTSFVVAPATARVLELRPQAPAGSALAQAAWPAVADFDADGDFDLVIGIEATRGVLTRLGDWIDDTPQRCAVLSGHYDGAAQELELSLASPAEGLAATHWRVDVWRCADATAAPAPLALATFDVAAPAGAITLPLFEPTPVFEAVYRIRLEPIQRDAQGLVVARGCPTLLSFSLSASAAEALGAEVGFEYEVEVGASLPENNMVTRPITSRSRRLVRFETGQTPGSAPQPN